MPRARAIAVNPAIDTATLLMALLIAVRIVAVWPLSDNHIYLLAYWCLAIGLALPASAPAATLSAGSRWLLGAAFALAVLWKGLLSPNYVDGRFFRVMLLTDERFADASLLIGGLTRDQLLANRTFLEPLPEGAALLTPPPFVEPPRLRAFATVATWGGLVLESLVALLNLIPAHGRLQLARQVSLLMFCATTYALARQSPALDGYSRRWGWRSAARTSVWCAAPTSRCSSSSCCMRRFRGPLSCTTGVV